MNYAFYITIKNDFPTMKDFHDARYKASDMHIDEKDIGILLTEVQWLNFIKVLSSFEKIFVQDLFGIDKNMKRTIFGFDIKII